MIFKYPGLGTIFNHQCHPRMLRFQWSPPRQHTGRQLSNVGSQHLTCKRDGRDRKKQMLHVFTSACWIVLGPWFLLAPATMDFYWGLSALVSMLLDPAHSVFILWMLSPVPYPSMLVIGWSRKEKTRWAGGKEERAFLTSVHPEIGKGVWELHVAFANL